MQKIENSTLKQYINNKISIITSLNKNLEKYKNNQASILSIPLIKEYISKDDTNNKALKEILISALGMNTHITQIKIVNKSAQEIVKVKRSDNKIYACNDNKLYNISKDSFFGSIKDTDKRYISKIEPKVSNNKIVKPIEPIIKVSVPLKNSSGIYAYFISYISLSSTLNKLSTFSKVKLYMFDNGGNSILLPSTTSDKSTFAYHNKNIQEVFPQRYKHILENDCDRDMFSVRQIYIADHKYTLVFIKNYQQDKLDSNLVWYITSIFILLSIPLGYFILKFSIKESNTLLDRISFLENNLVKKSQELEILKSRFESVEQIGNIGSFEYSIANETLWGSTNFRTIFGLDSSLITKESITSLIQQTDKRYVDNKIETMIHNRDKELEITFKVNINSNIKVVLTRLELMLNENKKPYLIKGIVQDITQKDTIEKELVEYRNLLEIKVEKNLEKIRKKDDIMLAQSRLASHGELISMLAHQWRQPLSTISTTLANIQLLLRLNTFDKEQIEFEIDNVTKLMKKLNSKIDDFRVFFQPTENKDYVDINYILKSSINLLEPLIEEHSINVKLDTECNTKISTFPNKLTQIVLNIVKNSIEQLVEKKILSPSIDIKCKIEDEKLLYIKISDNGGGIDDDSIFSIFDPYFSTKGKNGVGLGLFISKTIANKYLSGDIKAYNKEDGAVFLIELPI
jgi:PAS domain S-box-containing protein